MTYEELETGELLRVYYNEHAKVQSLQPAALPHADWKYEIWKHEGKVYAAEFYKEEEAQIHALSHYTDYDTIDILKPFIIRTARTHSLPPNYINNLWNLNTKKYVGQPVISREELYDLYVVQDLSATETATRLYTTHPTILSKLREYEIPVRKRGRRKKC